MTPARILIVEDDRVVARDLAQQLATMGHSVVGMISRGEEAVLHVVELRAELVLMDIRLEGETDGITAAQEIHDRCQIPVIFLTAYADAATVSRASRAEPFGYLLKPFEELQLSTVIELALHKHRAERQLRASEQRYATTLSSIGDGIISTDAQGRIIFMNPAAEALAGWPRPEALGRSIAGVFRLAHHITGEAVEDPVLLALRSGQAAGLPAGTLLLTRHGRHVPVDGSGAPVLGEDGQVIGAVLVFSDMTRWREAEEALHRARTELAHAARMAVLGELTASIAHEVNQPLMAAVTNAEACIRWLTGPAQDAGRAAEAARRVVRNGSRASEVIASIRALARNEAASMAPLDLRSAIQDVLVLMQGELQRAGITLRTSLAPALPMVRGDRVQLQQVLMNLVLNAREALGEAAPDGCIEVAAQPAQGQVTVTVADTGPGIAEDIVARIFDPLFTTKPGGMGLGLSICRSILDAHGGQIGMRPRSPSGCAFQITLPEAKHGPSDRTTA
ncbi:ATP-binding response regulator [Pseudoroseomonas ludipueritiae]